MARQTGIRIAHLKASTEFEGLLLSHPLLPPTIYLQAHARA